MGYPKNLDQVDKAILFHQILNVSVHHWMNSSSKTRANNVINADEKSRGQVLHCAFPQNQNSLMHNARPAVQHLLIIAWQADVSRYLGVFLPRY